MPLEFSGVSETDFISVPFILEIRWNDFKLVQANLKTRKFSVFEREKITLSIGDRIRFTKNVKHRGQKFLNNELRTDLRKLVEQ
jgi:hypothetical protein